MSSPPPSPHGIPPAHMPQPQHAQPGPADLAQTEARPTQHEQAPHAQPGPTQHGQTHPGPTQPGSPQPSLRRVLPEPVDETALRPVSRKLIPVRYIGALIGFIFELALILGVIALAWFTEWWWIIVFALLIAIFPLTRFILIPRRVKALGYLDRENDLVLAKGVMFRSVSIVPFGRIQSVEINEGPIERAFGLASITVNTAATSSGSDLPGLPKAEAERLRERLNARGIENMAAL